MRLARCQGRKIVFARSLLDTLRRRIPFCPGVSANFGAVHILVDCARCFLLMALSAAEVIRQEV